jgi:hypothetical protein
MSTLKINGSIGIQGNIQNNSSYPELKNWLNNLSTRGLPIPNNTVTFALNDLINGLYKYNLRTKIKRLNLFCGGDYISSFFPIITDIGSAWDWNGIYGSTVSALSNGLFTSSMWSLTGGFDPSSVNSYITGQTTTGAYIDTGINTSNSTFLTALQNYSLHFSCYVNTLGTKQGTGADLTEIGFSGGNSSIAFLRANYKPYYPGTRGAPGFYSYNGSTATNGTNALVYTQSGLSFDPRGFITGTRISNSSTTFYKNTTQPTAYNNGTTSLFYNPNVNTVSYGILTSNSTVVIFCDSANSAQGSTKNASAYSDRAISMYSIGTGLTDPDVSNYNTLIANFNTAIGRTNYTS